MSTTYEVTCINKSNRTDPYERITHIGGVSGNGQQWTLTQQEAIDGIESGKWNFYVIDAGQRVDVIVAQRLGRKYLKTRNDDEQTNNLLKQPECR